ncbi:right-handed parallel beta-helix repeat-containing protein [Dankookia sp. GCM10030260]|uniref:right-handed parallel beta-helix repeat-containing protein n=1 Tax=Dankookia sp. GCM10030260 TaxID=3273390 RepID=UPI00360FA539
MKLIGTSRKDALTGSATNDLIQGMGGNDQLSGLAGDDTLDGGSGSDTLIGGLGNDLYVVNSLDDVVRESAGQGVDKVVTSVTYTLSAEVENLLLNGTAGIGGTGNALANAITGNGGANLLTGGAGNDSLDGSAGADTLVGGTGDDRYIIDNAGDVVRESAGQGTDTVVSTVSYTLGANMERLSLEGTAGIGGTGNALANAITGNGGANLLSGGGGDDTLSGGASNDTLAGGVGVDRLTGGTGDDRFVFLAPSSAGIDTGLGAGARDRITDFTDRLDHIDLASFASGGAIKFIGQSAFAVNGGPQVRFAVQNGTTIVQVDAALPGHAADGKADAEIELDGVHALTAADFIGLGTATPPLQGAVLVRVNDDIQSMVDAAAPGTVFLLEAGEHRMQSIIPKAGDQFIGQDGAVLNGSRELIGFAQSGDDWVIGGQTQQGLRNATEEGLPGFVRAGYPDAVYLDDQPLKAVDSTANVRPGTYYFDYNADKIYIGDNPAGHKVEAAVSSFAFQGGDGITGVKVENLIIEKYASPLQRCTIGGDYLPTGWVIQDNEVRLNYGVGIGAGSNTQVLNNTVHDNGEMGLAGVGDNILIQGNDIGTNGYWSGIDTLWEGGGSKFALTDNLVVRGNHVHDNNGYGLWTDIDNIHTLYEGNLVENNRAAGINHEISYDAVIRNNTLIGNGIDHPEWLWGAGIQVQNSRNVEIYGNTVDTKGVGNGIALIQQDRAADGDAPYGPYVTINNNVHNNSITGYGASGAVADFNEDQMLAGGNKFDFNSYHLPNTIDDWFVYGGYYTWEQFRSVSGWEAHGTFSAI